MSIDESVVLDGDDPRCATPRPPRGPGDGDPEETPMGDPPDEDETDDPDDEDEGEGDDEPLYGKIRPKVHPYFRWKCGNTTSCTRAGNK